MDAHYQNTADRIRRWSTSEASETSPLIGDAETVHGPEPVVEHHPTYNRRHALWILVLLCLAILAIDFGAFLSVPPQIAIYEDIICKRMHGNTTLGFEGLGAVGDNNPCKSADVQGELALVNGWKDTLDQIPSIFLALPYGYMADHYGRKPVLILSIFALLLQETTVRMISWWSNLIPLRAIWITPLFLIMGGGSTVATSMVFTMITDLFPMDRRASIFFIVSASMMLSEILASPLAAFLMSWTPWLPLMVGYFFEIAAFLATLIGVPETLHAPKPQPETIIEDGYETPPPESAPSDQKSNWRRTCIRRWEAVKNHTAVIHQSANMICIALAFMMASIGRQSLQLVIQYASKRFQWSIAEASYLISLKGTINLIALLLLLPRLSSILGRYMSPMMKDYRISQGSVWLLTLGALFMAIAAHPPLFITGICILALGWGFYAAVRSLATGLVPSDQIGVLNTTLAVSGSVGMMLAGPVVASTFKKGLELGGMWMGLPYLVCAILFLGASVLTGCISISKQEEDLSREDVMED